jgi:hypothetical protein
LALDGRGCQRVNLQLESRGKPDSTKHAKVIFNESLSRISNGTKASSLDVVLTADMVNDPAVLRIFKHSIDRKISSFHILTLVRELDGVWMPMIGRPSF